MRKVNAFIGTYRSKLHAAGAAKLTTEGSPGKTFTGVDSAETDALIIAAVAGLSALRYPCEVIIHSTQDLAKADAEALDKATEHHQVSFVKVRAREHPEMNEARQAARAAAKAAGQS